MGEEHPKGQQWGKCQYPAQLGNAQPPLQGRQADKGCQQRTDKNNCQGDDDACRNHVLQLAHLRSLFQMVKKQADNISPVWVAAGLLCNQWSPLTGWLIIALSALSIASFGL
jgi:hypothetical protein